jgi:hypothetical protein
VLALTVEDSIAVALTAMKGEQCTSSLLLEFVAEGSDGGSRHNVFIIGRPLASSSASQLSSHSKPHFDVPFSWIRVNLCDENFTANTHFASVLHSRLPVTMFQLRTQLPIIAQAVLEHSANSTLQFTEESQCPCDCFVASETLINA